MKQWPNMGSSIILISFYLIVICYDKHIVCRGRTFGITNGIIAIGHVPPKPKYGCNTAYTNYYGIGSWPPQLEWSDYFHPLYQVSTYIKFGIDLVNIVLAKLFLLLSLPLPLPYLTRPHDSTCCVSARYVESWDVWLQWWRRALEHDVRLTQVLE